MTAQDDLSEFDTRTLLEEIKRREGIMYTVDIGDDGSTVTVEDMRKALDTACANGFGDIPLHPRTTDIHGTTWGEIGYHLRIDMPCPLSLADGYVGTEPFEAGDVVASFEVSGNNNIMKAEDHDS